MTQQTKDEFKSFFRDGMGCVFGVLVTISLGLGSYGLNKVVELQNETSVLKSQIQSVKENVTEINRNLEILSEDKIHDKVKLDVLSEKISQIDKNIVEIKSDLKEALKK